MKLLGLVIDLLDTSLCTAKKMIKLTVQASIFSFKTFSFLVLLIPLLFHRNSLQSVVSE